MKRKILVFAGVIAVAASIYVGRLWAQQTSPPARPPETPQTRIALINMHFVVQNYYKYKQFMTEMQDLAKPFMIRDQEKRRQYESLMREAQKPNLKADEREKIEQQVRQLKREVEDSGMEFQRMTHKRSEEALKLLFKDVQETATKFAQINNYEILMAYGEAYKEEDYYSIPFIQQRLRPFAFSPLWIKDGLDISKGVLDILNAKQPTPPAATGSSSSTPAPAKTQ